MCNGTFSHSDHSGISAGTAQTSQRPDGGWCESLSFTEVTARKRAMLLQPSMYVIPTCDCYSAIYGAPFFYVNSIRLSNVKRLHSPDYFY